MKTLRSLFFVSLFAVPTVVTATPLRLVTTTQDLAAIAQEVGGDQVEVTTIAKGYQDPHFVDAKPSYLLQLRRADLLLVVGLELEVGWLPPLLINARNPKILPGQLGYFVAAEGCDILQKPLGAIDRSMGDVHPEGNPHYWLDPENGRQIARSLAKRLSTLRPEAATKFAAHLAAFEKQLTDKEKEWRPMANRLRGVKVVTYHNSFPNFSKAFGIQIVNHVEPKPGIPPSPAHLKALVDQMKAEQVRFIWVEPYFDDKLPSKIAEDTGAKLLIFLPSVGGEPQVKRYTDLFDYDLKLATDALEGTGERP